MPKVFEEMANLDRLIHEPARLAILTALSSVARADFIFLKRLTGLTGGNLSSHIAKLEEAGLITVEKHFIQKRPNTMIAITPLGQEAIAEHWKQLDSLHQRSHAWSPEQQD